MSKLCVFGLWGRANGKYSVTLCGQPVRSALSYLCSFHQVALRLATDNTPCSVCGDNCVYQGAPEHTACSRCKSPENRDHDASSTKKPSKGVDIDSLATADKCFLVSKCLMADTTNTFTLHALQYATPADNGLKEAMATCVAETK